MSADDPADSTIPAPYTYFGQFIDHDITLTTAAGPTDPDREVNKPFFDPLDPTNIPGVLKNRRTSGFDLDCLYGLQPVPGEEDLAVPFAGDKFVIGLVSAVGNRPPGAADDNDLPRVERGRPNFRRARIGDPRNDENIIVAQLHLAFLKFHNAVVDDGFSFADARKLVTQHYQWLVLTDFLPRICDPSVVRSVLQKGNRLYRARNGEKFMPLEFAVAAYRFGHSMVRSVYDFNRNFRKSGAVQAPGRLDFLFRFTGLKGDLGGSQDTLPENWIVEWDMMLQDHAMQIDPTLTPFLMDMPNESPDLMKKLATRNLFKGYLFSLPTGQALAEALLPVEQRMTPADVIAACRPGRPGEKSQGEILESSGLHKTTPLWFYVLAEAKWWRGRGNHLGPLGSLIVSETIIGLIRENPESVLNRPFLPTLGTEIGRFDLQDLFIKAGVLNSRVATRVA